MIFTHYHDSQPSITSYSPQFFIKNLIIKFFPVCHQQHCYWQMSGQPPGGVLSLCPFSLLCGLNGKQLTEDQQNKRTFHWGCDYYLQMENSTFSHF